MEEMEGMRLAVGRACVSVSGREPLLSASKLIRSSPVTVGYRAVPVPLGGSGRNQSDRF